MSNFETHTVVNGIEAESVLDALLGHLAEHEFVALRVDDAWILDYESAQIKFAAKGDTLTARITAPTSESLFDARMMAHHHIAEFANCEQEVIAWEGDQPVFTRPPAFRVLTVTDTYDVSPHMRRIRFHGDDLGRYERQEDFHCKLLLPRPGNQAPDWPTLGPDGMPRFPTGEKRLDMRTYTIRRIDSKAGWMEIDFVLHDDAGPGADWAAQACPGQQIGVTGPGGRTARPSAWMLLAADETGLPAIARIAENLPHETRGEILIEVQGPADEISLTVPGGMQLRWLHRNDQAPGTSTLLRDAILASAIPDVEDRFAWVAAEFSTAQTVRKWLRDTVGMIGKDQLVVAYWRLGMDEMTMKRGGRCTEGGKAAEKAAE